MRAAEIAQRLRGRRNGAHRFLVPCPAHQDAAPSLSIADSPQTGKLLVHCFAGCSGRDVLNAFAASGFIERHEQHEPIDRSAPVCDTSRTSVALKLWAQCRPAAGTLAETYLRSRGIEALIPATIRFHPNLRYPDGTRHPAMVTAIAVAPDHKIVAIHRTYLDERGHKADVPNAKLMLGPATGGSARLNPAAERMQVAEGIENAFSAMAQNGLPTWAGLTASGIQSMILPPLPMAQHVTIAADNDAPRDHYPRGHGVGAAEIAAARWRKEGRTVEIVTPPDGLKGFNDVPPRPRFSPKP